MKGPFLHGEDFSKAQKTTWKAHGFFSKAQNISQDPSQKLKFG